MLISRIKKSCLKKKSCLVDKGRTPVGTGREREILRDREREILWGHVCFGVGAIAVVRAHFQHSGDAGPAANTLQSYPLPFGFAISKHPLEVLDPFFYRRHRVDLLPLSCFVGMQAIPDQVLGKPKSNSTGKEGCWDTPYMMQ